MQQSVERPRQARLVCLFGQRKGVLAYPIKKNIGGKVRGLAQLLVTVVERKKHTQRGHVNISLVFIVITIRSVNKLKLQVVPVAVDRMLRWVVQLEGAEFEAARRAFLQQIIGGKVRSFERMTHSLLI